MSVLLPLLACFSFSLKASALGFNSVTSDQWEALNTSVDGRLFISVPIAQPCFDQVQGIVAGNTLAPNVAKCSQVQSVWSVSAFIMLLSVFNIDILFQNTTFRVQQFGAYEQTFSERLHGANCDLNALNPTDPAALTGVCDLGSIPPYHVRSIFCFSISND
jgi:hypothetical protein